MSFSQSINRAVIKASKMQRRAPVISLEALMTRHYREALKKDKGKRRRGVFHPSAFATCRKAQQLELIYAPQHAQVITPKLMRIFETGHVMETRVSNAIAKGAEMLGGHFEPKVPVSSKSLLISGETDGILYMPDDHDYVVDVKTINRRRFSLLRKVSDDYLFQMHGYMRLTGIPQTIVFYERKDDNEPKEMFVKFHKGTWRHIKGEIIDYVLAATRKEKLVSRDEEKCTKQYCPFFKPCFADATFDEMDRRTDQQKRRLSVVT